MPDHWVKNAFILPGVAIAILLTDLLLSVYYGDFLQLVSLHRQIMLLMNG